MMGMMDSLMGDEGPLSYQNVMIGMMAFFTLLFAWCLSPWFPWK